MSRLESTNRLLPGFRAELPPDRPNDPGGVAESRTAAGLLSHYLELFRLNARLIAVLVLLCASLAGAYSIYKLNFSPGYRAAAIVTAQPTDAELRFSQFYVRSSPYDNANVITRSHIEYLKSHEIAARAHAILTEQNGPPPEPVELPSFLAAAKALKQSAEDGLRWLNSGSPAEENAGSEEIEKIQESIELAMVEGSFVMEIAVVWDDPQTAADLANIVAQVYQERSREQVAEATRELIAFLSSRKVEIENHLGELLAERNQLRVETGIVDIEAERGELLARLFNETERLDSERRELRAIQAKLETFLSDGPSLRYDGISREAKDTLNLSRFRAVELQQSVADRQTIVATLETKIRELSILEASFDKLNSEIERSRARLEDIDQRLLEVRVSQAESIETLRVIDIARPPVFPEEPVVLADTATGAAIGFLLAVMLVLVRDFVSPKLRTQAQLLEIEGVKVLGPVKLRASEFSFDEKGDLRAPADQGRFDESIEDELQPFLGWYEFDTDHEVAVIDVRSEARARVVARRVMEHYPFSDRVRSGVATFMRRPKYLSNSAAVLITVGRGDYDAAEFRDLLGAIRKRFAVLPVAVAFVDVRGKLRGSHT